MQSVQNLGLAVVPIIAGKILDTKGYLVLEVFFCACLCCKYVCVLYWKSTTVMDVALHFTVMLLLSLVHCL